jgi:hypothetical protein
MRLKGRKIVTVIVMIIQEVERKNKGIRTFYDNGGGLKGEQMVTIAVAGNR